MATTDRITSLDSMRSITDRVGETVILGSAKETAVIDADATALVVAAGASRATANFDMDAAIVAFEWFNGSSGLWITEFDMDAAASLTASGGQVVPAAFDADATAALTADTNQEVYEMRNKIINGNFDFWQRGTSLAAHTLAIRYLADRWSTTALVNHTIAASRQAFTLGQTDVPGEPTYFHRSVVVTGAANAGNAALFKHRLEGVRTLAGQTGRLTFWAKADASKNIALELAQNFGTGGAPSAAVTGIDINTLALTTSWQKFAITVTPDSISGKTIGTDGNDNLDLNLWLSAGSSFDARTNTLGEQAGTFDIAQVQFEEGSSETPFEVRPLSLELAMCQAFYEKSFALETAPVQNVGTTAGALAYRVRSAGAVSQSENIWYSARKRGTTTVTLYNPSAANAKWRNVTDGSDSGDATVITSATGNYAAVTNAQVAGDAIGEVISIHWTAEAEL